MKKIYIKKSEYDAIRKDLVSKNNELVKIALQNLITKLEYGQRISIACTKDLCAVLFDIVSVRRKEPLRVHRKQPILVH